LRDRAFDHRICIIVKSDLPKYKGELLKVSCGCRFPEREIEECIVESSSGQQKMKDPVCMDFRPAGWEGYVTNIDEVFVQVTYIEVGKTRVGVSGESSSNKEGKGKGNVKKENSTIVKEEKLSCKHCKKEGHDDEHFWKLHPKKRPKWFKERKGRQKIEAREHPTYLGSDSGDDTKITAVGLSGKIGDGYVYRSKLFHIRVIMKHTKIDTFLDRGSQANLISEEVVKKLGLKAKIHHKPYSLNWISKDYKLPITKQCVINFVITSKFLDEVICDVVPLETCGVVLGSPYLYDREAIFFREHNQYH
jgi:hypothetical protein